MQARNTSLTRLRVNHTATTVLLVAVVIASASVLTACQGRTAPNGEPPQVLTSFPSRSDAYAALQGDWRLVELRGQSVLETLEAGGFDVDRPPSLNITPQGGMGGFGGVNRLAGTIDAERIPGGKLVFAGGGAAMTMMAGPQELMDLEHAFVSELSAGRSIRLVGNLLSLVDESDSVTAVLERSR
ncbi:MAG: META domain-containing protein [Phycisphaeraceae bacterium]|nr:META domain-containing protein [Phycisphaeraceae bacterium]